MEDVMDAPMDLGASSHQVPQAFHQVSNAQYANANTTVLTEMDRLYEQMRAVVAAASQNREPFRDIPVKVHIRRPDRDSWAYMGRGIVSQEISGQSSRVVVRSASSHKILTVFGEGAALQAERRGNFVVIGCVEGGKVVSWSLNVSLLLLVHIAGLTTGSFLYGGVFTPGRIGPCPHIIHGTCNARTAQLLPCLQALNNSETVRLLASIELACYACKQAMADPATHGTFRRRVARLIKDDRRRRHKRRKDQDAMVAAFARTGLGDEHLESTDGAPPPTEPVPIPAPVPMPIPEPAPAPGGSTMGFPPPQ
ncbi:hypothetical protein C8Q76DRAFT_269207 [Earliella scabrosa]|nr:hypothetical protein C8Q76DRAFT_269207 [Earliella scabrosa]